MQHGPGNPIEVEDDAEGEPDEGQLIEIEEDVPLRYEGLPEYIE